MREKLQLTLDTLKRMQIRAEHRVIQIDGSICILVNKRLQRAMVYPYASKTEFNRMQMLISHNGTFEHLWRKYSYDGFSVAPGDTVIDIGSFIGSFAISAVQHGADRVIAVEPAPVNQRCLRANVPIHLAQPNRVEFIAAGVSNVDGAGMINLSSSGADNSLLEPDEGSLSENVEVELVTLKRIFERHGLDPTKTFLKVEAEGAEVEALEGLGDLRPHKIVVDVSPERDGEEPREQIEKILKTWGYCIVGHSRQCLFAQAQPTPDVQGTVIQ